MRNLTEVSLKNKVLVWYFIIVVVIGGIFAYQKLGRMEDPQFTIRSMVVTAAWPGATAQEMQEQVTDKLEKRIQDTQGLDHVNSETRPGQTVIYVHVREDVDKRELRTIWKDVRNSLEDIKSTLPKGTVGPFYNDRFDDIYGSIYAITGDGYSYEEMRQAAENMRRLLLGVKSVKKVELLGVQKEKVYVEIDREKLATLGIPPTNITEAISKQSDMAPSALLDTDSDNVQIRVTGTFDSVEAIAGTQIYANGKTFRLGDIAKVTRRFEEPAKPEMYFNGDPAIGVAVSMEDGGNILQLGKDLHKLTHDLQGELPAGLEIHQVSDQPAVVDASIQEFVETLAIAIVIVLAVSFFSLGTRTGLVVAGCIPLVLLGVFIFMYAADIPLHKVSLGSLIIALGLLVDDAIIAVEMMSVKLERGMNRFDAACYAFRATAKPMLTGTLITCSGFIPVAFATGMASEFCSTLFPVITVALVLSWIVSVMVAPLYGTYLIRVEVKRDAGGNIDPYQSRFYTWFRSVLYLFLSHKKAVLGGTAVLFAISVCLMGFIKEEFFPPSLRPEILVEMKLTPGASLKATEEATDRMSRFLQEHEEDIDSFSYYVGGYAPRFVLTVDPKADADNRAQFVIVTKGTKEREKLAKEIHEAFQNELSDIKGNIQYVQTGPPAEHPVMLRVTGLTVEQTKALAAEVSDIVAADPNNYNVATDWGQKAKTLHLEIDQAKLTALGLTKSDVATMIYSEVTGVKVAEYYTGDRTIDIDFRLAEKDRATLEEIKNLPIPVGRGGYTNLGQLAKISYQAEDAQINRYNLLPSIIVSADVYEGTSNDATRKALDACADLQKNLPFGASIKPEGNLKDSDTSTAYLLAPVPVMVFIIMTLLMFQLRNVKDMVMTLLTAPMGIIGVAFGMLLTDKAMGFVAILGVLALSGMIIRNSVILIDQIQKHLAEGEAPVDAIVDSAVLRFRPIMLTAAAAILGMVPLMVSAFWGPMAVAIASGLLVATVLTLLVLPAMYACFYHIRVD